MVHGDTVNKNTSGGDRISDLESLIAHVEANKVDKPTFKERMWRFIKPEIPAFFINVGSTIGAKALGYDDPVALALVGPAVEKVAIVGMMMYTLKRDYRHNLQKGMEPSIAKYTFKRQLKQDLVNILGVDLLAHDTFYSSVTGLLVKFMEGDSLALTGLYSATGFAVGTVAAAGLSGVVGTFGEWAINRSCKSLDYHKVVKAEHKTRERKFQLEPRVLFQKESDQKHFYDWLIWLAKKRGFKNVESYRESQTDTYYDTDSCSLLNTAAALKIRQSQRVQDEVLKLYFDTNTVPHEDYRTRVRERCEVGQEQWGTVFDGNSPREYLTVEDLSEYFSEKLEDQIGDSRLEQTLVVNNEKIVTQLERNNTRFDVVMDEFYFVDPKTGEQSGPYFGAEVKLKTGSYFNIKWIETIIGYLTPDREGAEVFRTSDTKYSLGYRQLCPT